MSNAGYDALEAENGERALELAQDRLHSLSLVVTDRIMPRLGGDALVASLHRTRPELPVLFMSRYAEVSPTLSGSAAVEHLQKPFTRVELLRGGTTVLQRAESTLHARRS